MENEIISALDKLISDIDNGESISYVRDNIQNIRDAVSKYRTDLQNGTLRSTLYAQILSRYIQSFVVPIILIDDNRNVFNASGCLIQLEQRLIITNYHVIQAWQSLRDMSDRAQFQIGSYIFSIDDNIIDYDVTLDLVTIRFPYTPQSTDLCYDKLFFTPDVWPQCNVQPGSIVHLAGWPGVLRQDEHNSSNIFYVSITGEITDVTDRRLIVEFNREQWSVLMGIRTPEELTRYGGFSGGPVFLLNDHQLSLVGIIFEDGASIFDGMRIIRSSFINRDGTINHV